MHCDIEQKKCEYAQQYTLGVFCVTQARLYGKPCKIDEMVEAKITCPDKRKEK
ncbi:MAG: hypothetical protein M0Z67_10060 [Nitrospiraceae bacterium]|nr:hypothetical protein [Nitrospiraceae bacterium]